MAGIEFYDFYDDHGIGIHILWTELIKKMQQQEKKKEAVRNGSEVERRKGKLTVVKPFWYVLYSEHLLVCSQSKHILNV